MLRILISGMGNIGFRHLQGVLKLDQELSLCIVEPYEKNLEKAKDHIRDNALNVTSICFHSGIDLVCEMEFDVAIIATNADVRFDIVKQLLSSCIIKYYILEKVVFQSLDQYNKILALAQLSEAKLFINFPRRYNQFYAVVKNYVDGKTFKMEVSGSNWGLGCNSVHFIDLFAMLSNSYGAMELRQSAIRNTYEAKRAGFIEYDADFFIMDNKGNSIQISCDSDSKDVSRFIKIYTEVGVISIDEIKGIVVCTEGIGDLPHFELGLQSDITTIEIGDLVDNGESLLTDLFSSKEAHNLLFMALSAPDKLSSETKFKIT